MKKLNAYNVEELNINDQKNIMGGSIPGKIMHFLGEVVGFLGAVASDFVAGGSNFLGD